MSDGTVPPIATWQPVAQVGRTGRTPEQQRKNSHSFEDDLTNGGQARAGTRSDEPPPPADPKQHERARGDLEDGTGESLDVTA